MGDKANALANAFSDKGAETFAGNPTGQHVELQIQNAVQWLRLGVETIGAIVIGIGILVALWAFLNALAARKSANFNAIRLGFARYLALALEFQLGADILSTAIAPTWGAIGRLAAIAVIRTALNYFLMREISEETKRAGGENQNSEETDHDGGAHVREHDNPSQHVAV